MPVLLYSCQIKPFTHLIVASEERIQIRAQAAIRESEREKIKTLFSSLLLYYY